MSRLWKLLVVVLAVSLFAASCGDDDADDTTPAAPAETTPDDDGEAAPATTAAATDAVVDTQGCDNTYHVITHGDAGTFWSVVEKAVRDAAAAIGCDVVYQGSNNDALKQSQDIEAAITAGSAGIAISLADPTALESAARKAVDAGIPLYTLNSGVNNYKDLGAVTHIGQTEFVAGQGAGERFNALGATKVLCGFQEQGNVGLDERCSGLEDTFDGEVVAEFIGLDANPDEQRSTISSRLIADESIDAVLGTGPNVPLRALEAAESAGRTLHIGGFDLSSDLINKIQSGEIAFTVDQQQYLQGYLPVILMHLQATNQNTAGGGLPVLTGPGFVTPENAAAVAALVAEGTR